MAKKKRNLQDATLINVRALKKRMDRIEHQTIAVPMHLIRLLVTERRDLKDPKRHADLQKVAKACLRVLVAASR